ncbi:hypothetical protein BH09MYX1_BH09MYX1_09460 [soil metagenome]
MSFDVTRQTARVLERAKELILGSAGLPHASLIELLQPSIKLVSRIVENDIPLGQSRFGGLPDLPEAVVWPRWDGYVDLAEPELSREAATLSFVAQIDLATLDDPTGLLPEAGLLSFFFDIVQMPWGYRSGHRGGGRVFYTEPSTPLVRRAAPVDLDPDAVLGSCMVSSKVIATLLELPRPQSRQWPEELRLQYFELARERIAGSAPHHRMFGWPYEVQGEMTLKCERMLRGVDEHVEVLGHGSLSYSTEAGAAISALWACGPDVLRRPRTSSYERSCRTRCVPECVLVASSSMSLARSPKAPRSSIPADDIDERDPAERARV